MPRALPFYIISAFANSPFEGNPAAVLFLDDSESTDEETLKKISTNFNQPITAFVYTTPNKTNLTPDGKTATFNIRWFTPTQTEIALCGHGTLAAARAIFARGLVGDGVDVLGFQTRRGKLVHAYRREDGHNAGIKLEIRLPMSTITELEDEEERNRVVQAVQKAFGEILNVEFVGKGGVGFEDYVLVELKVGEGKALGDYEVDTSAFLETGYTVNVVTTPSGAAEPLFFSRMFAPAAFPPGSAEDHVCGSAHCLLSPYWSRKHTLSGGQEFIARQVSKRGGVLELRLLQDEGNDLVALKGETCVIGSGEIFV
ncbi:phenazine biosynthesis PhzF protein [Mycena amicta]|nr:phenazine biosynthesis PhzF protein [Mycena amicta]